MNCHTENFEVSVSVSNRQYRIRWYFRDRLIASYLDTGVAMRSVFRSMFAGLPQKEVKAFCRGKVQMRAKFGDPAFSQLARMFPSNRVEVFTDSTSGKIVHVFHTRGGRLLVCDKPKVLSCNQFQKLVETGRLNRRG